MICTNRAVQFGDTLLLEPGFEPALEPLGLEPLEDSIIIIKQRYNKRI